MLLRISKVANPSGAVLGFSKGSGPQGMANLFSSGCIAHSKLVWKLAEKSRFGSGTWMVTIEDVLIHLKANVHLRQTEQGLCFALARLLGFLWGGVKWKLIKESLGRNEVVCKRYIFS